jgi:outer membrane protein assembly factor BamB
LAAGTSLEWNYTIGGGVDSSPAVGDVDGDGDMEIVVVSWDKTIYCLSTTGGIEWQHSLPTLDPINGAPIIADINRDGKQEVIVAYLDSCVYCYGSDGRLLWNYTVDGIFGPIPAGYEAYQPIIADIDGDTRLEIVIGSTNNNTYCLNDNGGLKWRYTTGGIISAAPVVSDVNQDGKLEVLVWSWDGYLYVLNANGGLLSRLSCPTSVANFEVTDVDGDGKLEIISEQNDLDVCSSNLADGMVEWRYSTGGGVTSPVVKDVDSDGQYEVVFGSLDKTAYCLSRSGSLKWSYHTGVDLNSAPVVTDIDNDGQKEVIFGSDSNTVFVFRGVDGVLKYSFNLPASGFMASPVIADLDHDGRNEVIIASTSGGSGPSWVYSIGFQSGNIVGPQGGGAIDYSLMPVLLVSGALIAIFTVLIAVGSVLVKRRTNIRGDTVPVIPGGHSVASEVNEAPSEDIPALGTSSAATCPSCGARVEGPEAEYCSSCGASIQGVQQKRQAKTIRSCMICNLPITSEEECLRCPHCGNTAHKVHLLEWLHVKGCCPVCRMDLHEEDLVRRHSSKLLRR